MLRNFVIITVVCFLLIDANAQVNSPDPLTKLVNSTLLHQVLNDFDRTIPMVLFAPGFYFIGSSRYPINPLFNESDFYDNEELVRTSDYYQKEIFDVLNSGFIPYIPVDSIMQVRVIHGHVLLFELKFFRKTDTVIFIQSDAERNKNKTVGLSGNKVISVSYYDAAREYNYNSRLTGDTLRTSEVIDGQSGKKSKSMMHYRDGFLSEISYYNIVSGEDELISTDYYYQNELNKPALKQSINRKGKITDSTHYYYDNDKLIHYQNFSGGNQKLSISYIYNRTGKLSGKTVKSQSRNYSNDYSYNNGTIVDLEIDDKIKPYKRHFVFKSDVQRRLAVIEYNTITKESLIENLKTIWMFGYNDKGNINSIKVMDSEGVIDKEILFEYVFFNTLKNE
ncbi:MAG: hypothetical protein V1775_04530 [Bacteroidota bacterium]